jgi:hypothetical protein
MSESNFISKNNNLFFKQNMPSQYCSNIMNQVYNNLYFNGEKIENITNIDDFILRTNV